MCYKSICLISTLSLLLAGCFGGSSGTAAAVVASTPSFLDSGTSLTYNSTNASTLAATTEFQKFNYNTISSQNPLEVINAHKAHGYGLTGAGQTIAIMDTGFSTTHKDFSAKTIATFGTLDQSNGSGISNGHGLFVAGIATAENDDTDGSTVQGVAPSANLHFSSYNKINGNSYFPTHWANATDNASSAVVQNNSWGINYQVDTLKSDISSNGWSNAHGVAQKWNSSGYTANAASASAYITALNNFQDHGVIVYSLSNTFSYSDADFQAALPELFSQLNEAWITAVNVEITGSLGSETYTRKSAPCGSTGAYCLGADGYGVNGLKGAQGNTGSYWENVSIGGIDYVSGTSFVAPQISGAVALLSEAFPSHTPAQITDRLLASADNTFFNHDAVVTFGNGISHGYDDEFGHGILDIYAALQPITSSSDNRSMSLYTGDSINDNHSFQFGNSRLLTSSSFGDSLQRGLISEVGYTYDDLDGGFKYDLHSHINTSNKGAPSISLSNELKSLSNSLNTSLIPNHNDHFNQIAGSFLISDDLNTFVTLGASSIPVQNFFELNSDLHNLSIYQTSYLEANEGGIGVNANYQLSNSRLLIGATIPIEQDNGQTIGTRKSLVSSLELGDSSNQIITLMAGITEDKDSLLGSKGSSAFSLEGSNSITTFTALKAQKQFYDNFSLTGIATFGNTNMSSPNNSFVDSASDVKSSSIALIANMKNLSKDDSLSFYVNQPDRVENGSVAIKTSSLADSNQNIMQTIKNIDLESSARQINMGFSYRKDLSKDFAFSLKHLITNNLNHSNTSNRLHSSYVGMDYKDLKLGISSNPNDSSIEKQISYAIAL
ncbi:S8 family peptidase [Candidatus Pseudothioglobus sp. Uisw_041]|uniref:S8 family peptidase n=1 Tax=Candidatus Pseudothioglobus sp. Uisw_041 TaxID=3230996 RepID=UPI003A8988D1